MNDIVQRLRDSATQARALDRSALLNEAADEIERLHSALSGYTDGIPPRTEIQFTLTDAELEALSWFTGGRGPVCPQHMATIRGLLERMK